MRAIFTQLSFLITTLIVIDLSAGSAPFYNALLWGLGVGCLIYLILLVGDYSVHKLLESSSTALKEARIGEDAPEVDMIENIFVTETPQVSETPDQSQADPLAA